MENKFEEDCKIFESLIREGIAISENAPSFDSPYSKGNTEQKGYKWFIKTINFLSDLFGEGFRDVRTFKNCFGRYESHSLLTGTLQGKFSFIKEDMEKGIGVLEGSYESFKNNIIRRNEDLVKSLISNPDKIKMMFDNDILNKIVEGELDLEKIKKLDKFEFYATHIQIDQLSRCKDGEKRARLFLNFAKIAPSLIPTESMIFGISRLGGCKFSEKDSKIKDLIKGNPKHNEDALIGETAINNELLLFTNDKTLKSRVKSNGGRAINLEEFKEILEKKGYKTN